jgi:hypothetical protein
LVAILSIIQFKLVGDKRWKENMDS